jgi:hypothetical protein
MKRQAEIEAVFFPETSVNLYQTALYHISEDDIVHSHSCEKSTWSIYILLHGKLK